MKKKKIGSCAAVIVAAGSGTRMSGGQSRKAAVNKIFLLLGDHPILAHTLNAFEACSFIDKIILVTRECDILDCKAVCDDYGITKIKTIVTGGSTRQESVRNGLAALPEHTVLAAIHDAARCLVSPDEIASAVVAAHEFGAAALGTPCKDSLKAVDADGNVVSSVARERVWQAQTPQVFYAKDIISAHQYAQNSGFDATDDCAVAENYGLKIKIVPGSYANIKITTPEDLLFAQGYLTGEG